MQPRSHQLRYERILNPPGEPIFQKVASELPCLKAARGCPPSRRALAWSGHGCLGRERANSATCRGKTTQAVRDPNRLLHQMGSIWAELLLRQQEAMGLFMAELPKRQSRQGFPELLLHLNIPVKPSRYLINAV